MSEAQPLVTIVTPSYNQAEFIRAAIESVLAQDYPSIEYIVMDGGSTDSTASIAAGYAGRLTWISERDRGQAHAVNKGFQRARGEIVAWLNSDDVLLPGAVSAAVQAFSAVPGVGAIYGEGFLIDRAGAVKGRYPHTESFNLWRLTWLRDSILQQSVFFRRAALEEVGWLDESLHWALDWDILVRLGKRFGLHYIPVEMGCLREYGETKTASGGAARFRELRGVLRRQTGAWWPPGCWYYGLDTYDKIWSEAIRAPGVGPLRPVADGLADLVFRLCRWGHDRTALRAQGLYEGGWAGPRMHWMLPRGTRRFVVSGAVPDWTHAPAWQRIRVSSGRHRLGEIRRPRGPFEWTADAGTSAGAEGLILRFDSAWSRTGGAAGVDVSWKLDGIHPLER